MALNDLRVEEQDLSNGDLTLEAREGESIEVLAHGISEASSGAIASVSIREETMLAYQADEGDDHLLLEDSVRDRGETFLTALRGMGMDAPTLKIPEGQELQYTTDTGDGTVTVLYDEQPADGVSVDAEGAPGNKARTFVSSGQTTQNIGANATEIVELEDSVNPSVLSDFPYGEDAPSGFEFDLMAVAVEADSTNDTDITLDNVKLSTEEVDFLARESDRISPAHFDYPDVDLSTHPLVFSAPPTFTPGQELDLEVEVTETGGASGDAVINSAHVFYRRTPGGGA